MRELKTHFPQAEHIQHNGNGEHKGGGWDDLMPINGINAMLRANLTCLVRRSGSLSKQVENLAYRLHIAFRYTSAS